MDEFGRAARCIYMYPSMSRRIAMRRLLPAALAVGVVVLIATAALASPTPQQDCLSSPCTYLPIVYGPQPSPTSTVVPPSTLVILSSRSYVETTSRYVVGEVYNGRSSPVYFVKIAARFYDAANALVAVADGYTFLDETAPGQRNPFKVLLTNAPSSIVRYDLSLTFQTSSFITYQPITVLSQQTRDNFGVEVFGEVRNDQTKEMQAVEVVVTFYDAAGQVVETDFGFPSATTLAPGATSPYTISTFKENLSFASYVVQGEGFLAA